MKVSNTPVWDFSDMAYIRRRYGVPAEVGMRVIANEKHGTIIGASGPCLLIEMDKHPGGPPERWHPTWRMTYLSESGEVLFRGEE